MRELFRTLNGECTHFSSERENDSTLILRLFIMTSLYTEQQIYIFKLKLGGAMRWNVVRNLEDPSAYSGSSAVER